MHSKALRNLLEFRETVLRQYGLTSPEWFVLGFVAASTATGGVKVGDIAAELDVQSTYVTGMLRKLEQKELIATQTDRDDRRARIITVSKKGAAVFAAVEAELTKQSDAWMGQISDSVAKSYLTVLEILSRRPPLN